MTNMVDFVAGRVARGGSGWRRWLSSGEALRGHEAWLHAPGKRGGAQAEPRATQHPASVGRLHMSNSRCGGYERVSQFSREYRRLFGAPLSAIFCACNREHRQQHRLSSPWTVECRARKEPGELIQQPAPR